MNEKMVIGQRYMSETEPELGLGMIVAIEDKTIKVAYSESDTQRIYSAKNPPLKRAIFHIGDEITTEDGDTIVIERIDQVDGVFIYVEGEVEIPETMLAGNIAGGGPVDKIFTKATDPIGHYALRTKTLEVQKKMLNMKVRGLLGPRLTLAPHQYYVADEVSRRGIPRVLLADEVGLGKTIEAGLIIHRLLLKGTVERVLIVPPNTLVYQWFVEMLRRFNLQFCVVNEETGLDGNMNPFIDQQLVISSLHLLSGSPLALESVKKVKWDLLVVDEAHNLEWSQTEISRPYQVIQELSAKTKGLLLLTATPEQLGLDGHFARLRLLDSHRYSNYEKFLEENERHIQVAKLAEKIMGEKKISAKDFTHLKDIITEDEQKEVLKFIDQDQRLMAARILVDHHGTGRVYFRNVRKSITREYNLFPKRVLFPHPVKEDKNLWVKDFLTSHASDKTLLICRTKEDVFMLEEYLKTYSSLKTAVFHSELSLMNRDRQAAYFADPKGAVVLLSTEIGSEGRNFQFAKHLILFDLPRTPDLLEQRIGRLDRIGQKNDVNIHVPYLQFTFEEILFHWYNQGLDAFLNPVKAGDLVYAEFKKDLVQAKAEFESYFQNKEKKLKELIKRTKEMYSEIQEKMEAGRDLLVELNSFNALEANNLVLKIREVEDDRDLEHFMELVFNQLGVEVEDSGERTYYIRPGDNMFVPHFPFLPPDGTLITYDRTKAIEREDFLFLTWDHPMVMSVIDLILGHGIGNTVVATWRNPQVKKVILEANYLLKCIAPKHLEIERYFPPTSIRLMIDLDNKDFSDKYTLEEMNDKVQAAPREIVAKVAEFPRDQFQKLLQNAKRLAETKIVPFLKEYSSRVEEELDAEILRIKSLQQRNRLNLDEELEFLELKKEVLMDSVGRASLSLDSFRLIV